LESDVYYRIPLDFNNLLQVRPNAQPATEKKDEFSPRLPMEKAARFPLWAYLTGRGRGIAEGADREILNRFRADFFSRNRICADGHERGIRRSVRSNGSFPGRRTDPLVSD
jgi:hypothetical protein